MSIANIGIEIFEASLRDQQAKLVHVDWRPPANGNVKMAKILELLNDERIEKANIAAFNRINEGEPMLVDVVYAKDVIPNMTKYTIGHAGPRIKWEDMCDHYKEQY